MNALSTKLGQYAAYHRDRRNIATHFVGIPMIVVAIVTLLSRPFVDVGGLQLSPAVVLYVLTSVYYFRLEVAMALPLVALHGLAIAAGAQLAHGATAHWLGWGCGLFVVGWVLQLVGHWWEGRKPAFVDDIVGLLIGPLFLVAETAFALGLRPELRATVDSRASQARASLGAKDRAGLGA